MAPDVSINRMTLPVAARLISNKWDFIFDDQKYISDINRSHKTSIHHHINIHTLHHSTELETEDKGKRINTLFSTCNYLLTLLPTSTCTYTYARIRLHICELFCNYLYTPIYVHVTVYTPTCAHPNIGKCTYLRTPTYIQSKNLYTVHT